MRKISLVLSILTVMLGASTATATTGTGEVQVNTGTTVSGQLFANTMMIIVGWTPVVNSTSAPFGAINAFVNASGLPFAQISSVNQNHSAHIGQFTVATGPPIVLYPAWQQNGAFNLNNTDASPAAITFGCVGGNVTGACLFNVRTIPSADPLF
ncbi:MAG: hypothetical protein M3S32_05930 [Acidobacteriota bacterium]|nr:hypothetical protein [Acidobacteriota bacterium]